MIDPPPANERAALRYVVLRHEGIAEPHFDLMFQTAPGSTLATWRSPEWPIRRKTCLTPLPDHRSAYLTYEGSVSSNRGMVRRVTTGRHVVIDNSASIFEVMLDDGSVLRLPRG